MASIPAPDPANHNSESPNAARSARSTPPAQPPTADLVHVRARIRKRSLPTSAAYALAAYVIGLGLFGSVAPSPLYQTYMELWSFSTLTLTLIYATYSFGVLATLLLAGSVSDDLGRRPVLLVALSALMASTLLFIVADNAGWLFVARGLQGIATGAAVSTASASLLDFAGPRGSARVSRTNAVATTAGTGLGILTTAVLVEADWAPRVIPYLILFGLLAIALAGACTMAEPVQDTRPFRLTIDRPHVPTGVRGPFLLASLAVISSWSAGGLFFSLGPSLGALLFESTNTVVSVLGIVVLLSTATAALLAFGHTAPILGATLGSVALAVGITTIAAATYSESGTTYLIGCSVAGFGFGIAFLGGLRNLLAVIPTKHRASVMSAFYVIAYASLSLPAVVAGLVVTNLGLQRTFQIFGAAVAVVALAAAALAWCSRPPPTPPRGDDQDACPQAG